MKKFSFGLSILFFSTGGWAQLCPQRPQQVQVGKLQTPELAETSGLRFSVRDARFLYHIADSGNRPQIFMTDLQGKVAKGIPLKISLFDSEALTLAPCFNEACLVVGDIGDNKQARPSIWLHFFRESRLFYSRTAETPDTSLRLKYPSQQGPQNAEALWTDPHGQIFLATKAESSGVAQLYSVDSRSTELRWIRSLNLAELPGASRLDVEKKKNGLRVTDADFNYQTQTLALLTYHFIFEFRWSSMNKKESEMKPGVDFVVHSFDEPLQYEGITYLPGSDTLYLTNEVEARANRAPLWRLDCLSPLRKPPLHGL